MKRSFSHFFFTFFHMLPRSGQSSPPMYTEVLPGDQSLALMITSLTEGMAGMYFCSASYANNVPLEISVRIETYGKSSLLRVSERLYVREYVYVHHTCYAV